MVRSVFNRKLHRFKEIFNMATAFSRPYATIFFLWYHLKFVVYDNGPRSVTAPHDNNLVACAATVTRVYSSILRRDRVCELQDGRQSEHVL
jgi:hypothetical protein